MRLILARHGETSWNRERRNQGQNPTELNAQGIRQAQKVAQALRLFPVRALYSSPLRRAMQTSEIIGQTLSLPIIPRDGLMEMDLGLVDGLTNDEMTRRFRDITDRWRRDPSSVQMPGGESLQEVQERASLTLETIRHENPDGHAAAVSHNFVIGVIVLRILGLPLSGFQRIRVELGSLTTLEHDGDQWRIVSLNETLHQHGG